MHQLRYRYKKEPQGMIELHLGAFNELQECSLNIYLFFMVTLGFEVNADKKFSQKKLKGYLLNVWRR